MTASGSQSLRILHVIAPAPVGGAESVIQALAPEQAAMGDSVCIAAVVEARDTAARRLFSPLREYPLRLEEIVVSARGYLREARALEAVARSHQPHVLHTHGYRSDLVAGLVGGWVGIPRVSTIHGFTGGGHRGRFYERLQRFMLRRFEAVVAVSPALVDELVTAGIPASKLHFVRNAWRPKSARWERAEARERLGIGRTGFHIGWVGRFSWEKGPDVAVRTLATANVGEMTLHFVGDGPMKATVLALADDLGVRERVRTHGLIHDAARFMSAFDVLLLTSRTEGTPMVIFEAMAAEVPVIATAVGGVPDVVEGAGWLVPPDDPGATADVIRDVRDRPQEARRRTTEARRRLDREFSTREWAQRYRTVYGSALP